MLVLGISLELLHGSWLVAACLSKYISVADSAHVPIHVAKGISNALRASNQTRAHNDARINWFR